MGIVRLFSRCSDDSHTDGVRKNVLLIPPSVSNFGNPDPSNFRILKAEEIKRFTVLLVRYPDCFNFEGKKILVFKDIKWDALQALGSLDPHFCNAKQHISPLARFAPTKKGWDDAVWFCTHR